MITLGIYLVLCHLTLLCTLIVRHGALALALGLMVILWGVLAPTAALLMLLVREDNTAFAQVSPIYYVTFVVCGMLQAAIIMRLEAIAGR